MPEERALIHFRCVAEKHQGPKGGPSDMLTIHEGRWAYCPFDIREQGHRWAPTGGLSVNDLRSLIDRERNARTKSGS